jgi:hypothetical protein
VDGVLLRINEVINTYGVLVVCLPSPTMHLRVTDKDSASTRITHSQKKVFVRAVRCNSKTTTVETHPIHQYLSDSVSENV